MGRCGRRLAPIGAKLAPRPAFNQGPPAAAQPGTSSPGTHLHPQPHQTPFSGMGFCAPVTAPPPRPQAGTHQVQLADLLLAFDVSLVICENFKPVAVKKRGVTDSRNA